MVVKKVKQWIAVCAKHPTVAAVIGCLKIGEGIRIASDGVEFLWSRIPVENWSVAMSTQTDMLLAMAVTTIYAVVVTALAVRSRRQEDEDRRRHRRMVARRGQG